MKRGMTELEFEEWKKDWYERVPKCKSFNCCHELMSCGIKIFCGDCSIYSTYARDKEPRECTTVGCDDCTTKYECKDYRCRGLMGNKKCIFDNTADCNRFANGEYVCMYV